MSVYGTGRHTLRDKWLFSRVWLPALSARPRARRTVGSRSPYSLQRAIPSARGSVTPRSPCVLRDGPRNIDRVGIALPLRVRLSSRLTPGRLASPGNPWVFGVSVYTLIVVTHAYIFFSGRSSKPRGSPSAPTGMLPYHACVSARVLGFGYGLDARSSSTRLRSTSELLRTL